jgi:hypothetical protein
MVCWQVQLERELVGRLPEGSSSRATGSTSDPDQLDGWSDLDLHIDLRGSVEVVDVWAGLPVWAASEVEDAGRQVLRVVLVDGRRIDLVVKGGRVQVPVRAADNEFRMVTALAATKLGRGDHLIGLHLTLELMRSCLVQAMVLRDRAVGTTVHRFGSTEDAMADEVIALLGSPIAVVPRPNGVEQIAELYGRWRRKLEPDYTPDWSGLRALLDRGLSR